MTFIFEWTINCGGKLFWLKMLLAHKSWNLDTKTLLNVYKSLVRSLLDYSSFLYGNLSFANKQSLQSIQNTALRLILRKKREDGSDVLHEIAKIEPLEIRMKNIMERYTEKAECNLNPLISDLIDDYSELRSEYQLESTTVLCGISYVVDLLGN